MRLVNTLRGTGYLAVAALGLALNGQVLATPDDDVVIVRHSTRQIEPTTQEQVVSLARRVSYADLDLSTSSGAKQLEVRVHQVASSLCDELERRSVSLPNSAETVACVNGAVADGMEHARAAIAAAEKRTRTSGAATSR
jgi:UrcA family protein